MEIKENIADAVITGNSLVPVFLNLEQRHVLIIGGGAIGLEKLDAILTNSPSARVTLVARNLISGIRDRAELSGNVVILEREYEVGDLLEKDLIIAATNDRELAGKIREDAMRARTLTSLNDVPAPKKERKKKLSLFRKMLIYSISVLAIMIAGHILFTFLPLKTIGGVAVDIVYSIDSSILWFILGGFIAQLIDGALGMAYGVSATTFLLSFGVSPAAASASVHASEIFTSGVSGLMHLKFGNVNNKLFRNLLIPGVIGAILGAYILTFLEEYNYIIKPLVGAYTLFLGIVIISKALKKDKIRKRIKRLIPLAMVGGFLDSLGGGGWGPIVSSTLIARGRNPRYTIGSVNLAEFFVALASSLTFTTLIGITHWQIIAGLIIGGCIAAPIAAYLSSRVRTKTIMIFVGVTVVIVSLRIIYISFT